MKHSQDLQKFDTKLFAQQNHQLQLQTPVTDFPRLVEAADSWPISAQSVVYWQLNGFVKKTTVDQEQIWLELKASVHIPLTCQKCLEACDNLLSVDRQFRFVKDEATALRDDDDSEEDLLVFDRLFNISELLEDELLMEIPLIPVHETCPKPLVPQTDDQALEPEPSPFAVLAQLKDKSKP